MTAATKKAPLFERAKEKFYGSAPSASRSGGSMDQVDQSYWQPRIRDAKVRNDLVRAKYLEAQRSEFFEVVGEIGASPDQARRIAVVMRDVDREQHRIRPRGAAPPPVRERLSEADELHLQQKHGEKTQEFLQRGYARTYKSLETKPALLEAIKQGGAWAHRSVAEVMAEIGAAPDAPPTPPPSAA